MFAKGCFIGGVPSLLTAGGELLSIPFIVFCKLTIHTALGTSSALGFPIALVGAAGYLTAGLGSANLSPLSLG